MLARNPRQYRILHTITSLHTGGAGRLLLRNTTHLDRVTFSNFVCYFVPQEELLPEFTAAGCRPICLGHRRTGHSLRTLLRLIGLIRRLRIDLIHTNLFLDSVYSRIAAAVVGLPVVTTLHTARNPVEFYRSRPRSALYRLKDAAGDLTARWLTRRFVAVSGAVHETFVTHRGVPMDRAVIIRSGVPVSEFAQAADPGELAHLRKELGIGSAFPVLINVGRLHEQKGQHYLIPVMADVVRRWPHAVLLVVGEGAERTALQESIERSGLSAHIILVGQRSDVRNLLALSEVFVFPSIPGREGLPLAVLEAMAAGKPVVAFRVEGVSEVVEDGVSGYLVEPGQPGALSQALRLLLESPERVRKMGGRGQQIARESLDIEVAARRLSEVYLSILNAPAAMTRRASEPMVYDRPQ